MSIAGGGKTGSMYRLAMDNKGPHLWPPSEWFGWVNQMMSQGASSWAQRGYYLQRERSKEDDWLSVLA